MHDMDYISYAGTDSYTIGDIVVTKSAVNDRPRRKYETINVPGRNGSIIIAQDAYENVQRVYEIVAGSGRDSSSISSFYDLTEWLMPEEEDETVEDRVKLTCRGYHQLIDGGDPDTIMLACFNGPIDVDNILKRAGRAQIVFSCRPERFTADAFDAITLRTSGAVIYNPCSRPAKPHLIIYGTDAGTVTVNGYSIAITSLSDGYLRIDCEAQDCYRTIAENRNNRVSLTSGFPRLSPVENEISWSGGITRVDVIPRWWRL